MAALSDAGLRRSEASSVTWEDVQRWDDGSGRHRRHHSRCHAGLSAGRPQEVASDEKVFGLPESQIARRVKAIAGAAGLAD